MLTGLHLPLAAAEGPGLEIIFWFVAAVIWVISQIATARQNKRRRQQRSAEPQTDDRYESSGAGASPAAEDLAEIFKRLGADIPATPPPPPRPAPAPPAAPAAYARPARQPPSVPRKSTHPARVQPEIARRLARARKEADEAARQVEEAARLAARETALPAPTPSPNDETTRNAIRNSGLVLPRLHSMDLRMTAWPSVPMPPFSSGPHKGKPLRVRLSNRRELRDAVIAQALLHPPKSQSNG